MHHDIAKWLIAIGAISMLIGLVLYVGGSKLAWLGRLPGDIRIEREGFRFYFPITTMILLSLVINIFFRLWRHFW